MKKIAAFILILMLIFPSALAEDSIDQRAEDIFQRLVAIYDTQLNYLEEERWAWKQYADNATETPSSDWYTKNFLLQDMRRYTEFYSYFSSVYHVDLDNEKYGDKYERAYNLVFKPICEAAGARTAVMVITQMIYGNDKMPEYLDAVKSDIHGLMNDAPDYQFLKELQDFYRSTVKLLEYAVNWNDSYIDFAERIDGFKETEQDIRFAFEFAFDWPEDDLRRFGYGESCVEEYKALLDAAADSMNEEAHRFDSISDTLSDGLCVVYRGEKAGAIDVYGNVVVPIVYDSVYRHFSDGMAPVVRCNAERTQVLGIGFVDAQGNLAIPFNSDYVGFTDFSEGLAGVMDTNQKIGFIDKTGRLVIPYRYDAAYTFSEGLCAVKKDGKWGFIDRQGNTVIKHRYNEIYPFTDGLAYVDGDVIDRNGTVIFHNPYDRFYGFHEGLAYVARAEDTFHEGKYIIYPIGYINTEGQLEIEFKSWTQYEMPGDFHDGLADVKKDGKYGFIDTTGRLAIQYEYDDIYTSGFSEGLCRVKKNDKWGVIDKTGKMIVPCIYERITNCENGRFIAFADQHIVIYDCDGNVTF